MGIVYLVQPGELLDTKRFKVGCSEHEDYSRLSKYHKNCKIISIRRCGENYKEIEKIIINEFKNKYKLITGNEYFEGNIKDIDNDFNKIVSKDFDIDVSDVSDDSDDNNFNNKSINSCTCVHFNDEEYYDNECVACRNTGVSYWSEGIYGECLDCGGNCIICGNKYRKEGNINNIENIKDLSKYFQYKFDNNNKSKFYDISFFDLYEEYNVYFNDEDNIDIFENYEIMEKNLFKIYIEKFKGIKIKNKDSSMYNINKLDLINFLKDNNLYNNNIIKNYEDLINKTKFNKIIIEKKKTVWLYPI
jgi:hypothetical protein